MVCLRVLRAWRPHVFGVLACFPCSSAWHALRGYVLSVLHEMACLACFRKWRDWRASKNWRAS